MPLWALLVFGLLLLVACEDGSSPATEDPASYHDPGRGPFEEVATEDLVSRCGLDPDILASIDASINYPCLLYTSPSPRDATLSRMPSSA